MNRKNVVVSYLYITFYCPTKEITKVFSIYLYFDQAIANSMRAVFILE